MLSAAEAKQISLNKLDEYPLIFNHIRKSAREGLLCVDIPLDQIVKHPIAKFADRSTEQLIGSPIANEDINIIIKLLKLEKYRVRQKPNHLSISWDISVMDEDYLAKRDQMQDMQKFLQSNLREFFNMYTPHHCRSCHNIYSEEELEIDAAMEQIRSIDDPNDSNDLDNVVENLAINLTEKIENQSYSRVSDAIN